MTYPADHNQQLNCYLQAWRQVLEPLTPAITAAMPFSGVPWGMPPMPPMPPLPPMSPSPTPMPTAPPPPMPADYTQQLFGYLQAWRQYLEQATGARPAPAQPADAQPTDMQASRPVDERGSAHTARPESRPTVPLPPDNPVGGRTTVTSYGTSPAPVWPPPKTVRNRPNEGGTQSYDNDGFRKDALRARPPGRQDQSIEVNPDRFGQAAAMARSTMIGKRPGTELGGLITDLPQRRRAAEPQAQRPAGSPVAKPARPAAPAAPMRAAGPLYRGLAERAAAKIQRELG